jgi:hypothetical protein
MNNKILGLTVFPLIIGVVIAALVIAVLPLAPSLEDYFVQGMYYEPGYKVFIGFPNKARHVKVLEAYYKNSSTYISADMSWKDIGERVDGMFSQHYGLLSKTARAVHFYGNDGICLFKFFVRKDDARRSRYDDGSLSDVRDSREDTFLWFILILNLLCFAIIFISYVIINIILRYNSRRFRDSNESNLSRRNHKILQMKVSIIVATDFLCWVPFIMISIFHNLMVFDATNWYTTLAMITQPLNSVINPLIYEDTIKDYLRQKLADVDQLIAYLGNSIRQSWPTRELEHNIEMNTVERTEYRGPENETTL